MSEKSESLSCQYWYSLERSYTSFFGELDLTGSTFFLATRLLLTYLMTHPSTVQVSGYQPGRQRGEYLHAVRAGRLHSQPFGAVRRPGRRGLLQLHQTDLGRRRVSTPEQRHSSVRTLTLCAYMYMLLWDCNANEILFPNKIFEPNPSQFVWACYRINFCGCYACNFPIL